MKRWLLFAVPCFCLFVSLGALSAIWLPNTRPFSTLNSEQQATLAKLRSGENRLDHSMNILVLGTDVVASRGIHQNWIPRCYQFSGRALRHDTSGSFRPCQ